jgi:hypothetical protein
MTAGPSAFRVSDFGSRLGADLASYAPGRHRKLRARQPPVDRPHPRACGARGYAVMTAPARPGYGPFSVPGILSPCKIRRL